MQVLLSRHLQSPFTFTIDPSCNPFPIAALACCGIAGTAGRWMGGCQMAIAGPDTAHNGLEDPPAPLIRPAHTMQGASLRYSSTSRAIRGAAGSLQLVRPRAAFLFGAEWRSSAARRYRRACGVQANMLKGLFGKVRRSIAANLIY